MKYIIHISMLNHKAKAMSALSLVDSHGWMVVTGDFNYTLALHSTYILNNNGSVLKSPFPEGVRFNLKTISRVRLDDLVNEYRTYIGVENVFAAIRKLFIVRPHQACKTLWECNPRMTSIHEAIKFLEDNYKIGASEFSKTYDVTDRQIESYNKSREVRTSVVNENKALREHIHNLNTAAANALADMAVLLREQKPNWEDGSFNVDGQSAAELHAAINKPLNIGGDIYKQVAEQLKQHLCDVYRVPRHLLGDGVSAIIDGKKYA